MRSRRVCPLRAARLWFLFFAVATPTLHPWYVAFLVPFLCVWPNPGVLAAYKQERRSRAALISGGFWDA